MVVVIVQSLSCVWLFVTPRTAACQASCPLPSPRVCSNSCPLKQWCHPATSSFVIPLLLLSSIFPSIRVFSNDLALHIQWLKHWSFRFSISPSNEYSGLISLRLTDLISLLSKGLSSVFSRPIVQKHHFFSTQPSLQSSSHICTWLLGPSIIPTLVTDQGDLWAHFCP